MRLPALLLFVVATASCAADGPDSTARGEARARQSSKADGPDQCAGLFYGDGQFCDCWCPDPDPDCAAGLPLWQECDAPPAQCDATMPCATCAGLDCPTVECVDGLCVELAVAECGAAMPCATCAGLDCPVMDCVDGRCVAVGEPACSATMPCATCAGLDCPEMACVDGQCVAASAVECSATMPCATCAGPGCPVMDCVDGQCVAIDRRDCPDPTDPDVSYRGFTEAECQGATLCSNNEVAFDIVGCGCGCEFIL